MNRPIAHRHQPEARAATGGLVLSLALGLACALPLAPEARAQAASAPATAALAPADRSFAEQAAAGGLAEVDMGRTGQQKGHTDAVRQFGARMVQDHGKANDELMRLLASKNVALPADLPGQQQHQQHATQLGALNGPAFDKAFMDRMVQDHAKTVALFERHAREGRDADLKAFATRTLPTLRDHLASAKSIQASLK